jgi:hypothetical protein
MKKILFGLVAAVAIAVGGFFGFQFYVEQKIAGNIDAAFDQIRKDGGKASHGRLDFDLWTHTLTIADIKTETAAQPPMTVKIAKFTAAGVGQPDATHVAAASVEAGDIEVGARMIAGSEWRATYKVPGITVKDYSGPATIKQPPALSSVVDMYQFVFGMFKDITAASITAPSAAFTVNSGAAIAGEGSYSGLEMLGVRDGKVANMKSDGFAYTMTTQQAGRTEKVSAKVANFVINDFDGNAAATTLDPSKADDSNYYRVYGHLSIGSYDITAGPGVRTHIGGIVADDIAVKPSRVRFGEMLSAMPQPGAVRSPSEAREIMEKVARIYEGIRIANAAINDISVETSQGQSQQSLARMSALRLSLEDGKGEFALEGLDANSPNGPVRIERFALKAFDIPNLMRAMGSFANPAQRPPSEQTLRLLQALGGIEVKGVVAPYKNSKQTINIDAVNLTWGQFVGLIPTKAHLDAKLAGPVDPTNPAFQALAVAGINRQALDVDISAGWDEAAGSFVLDAPSFELSSMLKASVRVSLGQVPRGVFTLDPQQASAMAEQIEAGALELTLHDLGAVDLLVAQYARTKDLSREAARSAIVDEIRANSEKAASANPDAPAAIEAMIRFVETPGQTLVLKLTPLGKAQASQLMQLLKNDPLLALAQFRIEASTGL